MRATVVSALLITLAGASDARAQWGPIVHGIVEEVLAQRRPPPPPPPVPLPLTRCSTAAVGVAIGSAHDNHIDTNGSGPLPRSVGPTAAVHIELPAEPYESLRFD